MIGRAGPAERPLAGIRSLPRRFIIVFALAIALALTLVVTLHTSGVTVPAIPQSAAELQEHVQQGAQHAKEFFNNPNLPQLYNPFGEKAHQPPQQEGSQHGDTKWYNDWKWLNPFSSTVTLDDYRAVLPPVKTRTPIYTFYDSSGKADNVKAAENGLLLAWRRAWWAQGFKPVVLNRADSHKSIGWYQRVQNARVQPAVEKEMERWMAWHYMGGGVLSNWLVFPMAQRDDDLLSFLRRGEFDKLTKYKGLGAGLFSGSADGIAAAINVAFADEKLRDVEDFLDLIPRKIIDTDGRHDGVAFYDLPTITSKYASIAQEWKEDQATALTSLHKLINSHLATTWQNLFPNGITIIKSFPEKTTNLVASAVRLGQILRQCPESPLPASCPPNRPSCTRCSPDNLMQLSVSPSFANDTKSFSIGTVAHPVTFNSIIHSRENLDTSFVRRDTKRDQWIISTTSDLLGKGILGPQRLVHLKEAVAGEYGAINSLWFTAEREDALEWDWVFGFQLSQADPKESSIDIQARLKGTSMLPKEADQSPATPDQIQLSTEKALLDHAVGLLRIKSPRDKMQRDMVEAWNLADTEAWRFVRAFNLRRKVERTQWEEAEKSYAGAERTGRWFDR